MFETLPLLPDDPILRLIHLYRNDPRTDKIDVGVGVFRNDKGETPIMQAVAKAQTQLLQHEITKSYLGLEGNPEFNQAMIKLILGEGADNSRVRAVQAPGGSGAIRILGDMLGSGGNKTIWVSDPTWGNHIPIFQAAGFTIKTYPYLDTVTKTVDEEAFFSALQQIPAGDLVLFHGCCHNPSGADLSPTAWDSVAEIVNKQRFLPFIDIAYQGFGKGLEEDMYGVRKLVSTVDELVISASCSKNFGLYRERVGVAIVVGKDRQNTEIAFSHLLAAGRKAYSMPPNHGAACVALILNDNELRSLWETELNSMRSRIHSIRAQLADALVNSTGNTDWQVIKSHQGMFSLLCLDKATTDRMVNEESIYIVNGGRINLAGFQNTAQIERFAKTIQN